MSVPLGLDAKVYRLTTGTRATWGTADSENFHEGAAPGNLTEIGDVRSVSYSQSKTRADISKRGLNYRRQKGALIDLEVTLEMIFDPANANHIHLADSFAGRTTIALAILSGDKATVGVEGIWADFEVMDMEKGEELEEGQIYNFTLVPGDSSVDPELVRVTS